MIQRTTPNQKKEIDLKKISSSLSILALSVGVFTPIAHAKDLETSAPREIISPYAPVLQCLKTQIPADKKNISFGVSGIGDATGKISYSNEGATGTFLSQNLTNALIVAISRTGVPMVNLGGFYRSYSDWSAQKIREGGLGVGLSLPDIMVEGSFATLDFGPSKVGEVRVMGIGGGSRKYTMRYTADLIATAAPMPRADKNGRPNSDYLANSGRILSALSLQQDVIGREGQGGGTGFFGSRDSSTFIEINFGTNDRQLPQYMQRIVVERAAAMLVADVFNISSCQDALLWGDDLLAGNTQEIPAETVAMNDKPAG